MPKGSPLNKAIKKSRAPREQIEYRRRVKAAVKKSAAAPASVGRVTNKERGAIKKVRTATRIVTTRKEAAGLAAKLRKKARKS